MQNKQSFGYTLREIFVFLLRSEHERKGARTNIKIRKTTRSKMHFIKGKTGKVNDKRICFPHVYQLKSTQRVSWVRGIIFKLKINLR